MEVQPSSLALALNPGAADRDIATGVVVIRVATNATRGFVVRLLGGGGLQATTTRSGRLHAPNVTVEDAGGSGSPVDVMASASSGIVVAESSRPVPPGEVWEYRVRLAAAADFTTTADTYAAQIRFEFEPRYQ
jgi:hypothetical protein